MKQSTNDPPPKRSALASPKADLRELKGNSRATVAELKEFLHELKGKSPQEMLGIVSGSQLIRALIFSTALVFGLIVVFTIVPYFFGEKPEPTPQPDPVANTPTPEPTPNPPEPPSPTPEPDPVPEPDPISKLGVGEELPAPPDKNPLENTKDDFLKDLDE